jgi:hypothetical protein
MEGEEIMAFKEREKFWDDEPIVVHEFEKGSKLVKALYGVVEGKLCGALQTFYIDRSGVEKPSKGWFMVDSKKEGAQAVIDQINDSINALEELKRHIEKGMKKGGRKRQVTSSVSDDE